jgi:pimeloyl-ACP methyl ester carboxylesterase
MGHAGREKEMAKGQLWSEHVEPSLPMSEGTANVEGLDVYYRTGGSGPPLLMMHGFTGHGTWWEHYYDALGEDYTLVVPDLPGHGRSGPLPGDLLHREVAPTMVKLMESLGHDRFYGVGHSSGGIILIHMALQSPERLDGMVIAAGGHRLSMDVRVERRARRGAWESPEYKANAIRMHRSESQARWIVAQFDRFADEYGDFAVSPEHLATIQTPTLLVWGDRDTNFPVEFALEMYRAMPNAALWVIPGQPHGALWTSEEAVPAFPGTMHAFFQGKLVYQQ